MYTEKDMKEIGYNMADNYCSYSPDKIFGVKFNYACYLHDRQYRNERVKRFSRKKADRLLRNRIIEIYKHNNLKKVGYIIAYFYYIAVRLFGWLVWTKGDKK